MNNWPGLLKKSTIFLAFALLAGAVMLLYGTNASLAQSGDHDSAVETVKPTRDSDAIVSEPVTEALPVSETGLYIVQLVDSPLATYDGGVADLAATSPAVTGADRLDVNAPESIAYLNYLQTQHYDFINNAELLLDRPLDVQFQYLNVLNGLVLSLDHAEAIRLAELPSVKTVYADKVWELTTDVGPLLIGAPAIWEGDHNLFTFHADLDGGQENPPVLTGATGEGMFAYDPITKVLTWEISHDIPMADVTAAHIHIGAVGVNGPVVIPLDHTQNPMVGSATLDATQQADLMNHLYYVNVHTNAYPGGEIRGQMWTDGHRGEGVIVGMLDTGVNPVHPSFAEVDGDGFEHENPYGSGNFVGVCEDPLDSDYEDICNDKLIGAWNFHPSSPSATDWNDHGSHVGSTIAGNRHDAVFTVGSDVFTRTVSGVAPRANVISYLVCFPSCPSSSSVAAVNQAIADGVDVLNYSISGGDDPWNATVDLAFLDATAAGMFVSASAGNDGPGPGTVTKTGPWNAAVAASTHSRVIANTVDVIAPSQPPELQAMAAVPGSGPDIVAEIEDDIVWAGDVAAANVRGCSAFPADSFEGAVALIQRGDCTFETKVTNATNAGAVAVIVYNHVGGPPISMGGLEPTTIPAVFIDKTNGDDLVNFVSTNADPAVRINAATSVVVSEDWEDVIAGFSSRGPSQWDLLKPDYTAPGVNILAAGWDGPDAYAFIQGTSMSSPHGAGAAALLVQLNPTWTPAQVKSALALTANQNVLHDNGVTPAGFFDMGSGRIDLAGAANTGLVMNETIANYVAANPYMGGAPRTLNQPSLQDGNCYQECSWSRTLTNVTDQVAIWRATYVGSGEVTITPDTIALAPNQSASFDVHFNGIPLPQYQWYFGQIIWSVTSGAAPDVALPLAAYLVGSTDPHILTKEASEMAVETGDIISYTVSVYNTASVTRTYMVTDVVPANATFVPDSEIGFTYDAGTDTLTWMGEVGPTSMDIITGTRFGYVSLASLGVSPFACPTNCDEGGFIISGLDFYYLGEHYDRVIWSINGTVEAGAASLMAASWNNVELPDPALPNNLLAPWWTDLDLTDSGNWYVASVAVGPNSYYVFEWEDAPLWSGYGNAATFTFQVWIQVGADNIWFAYGDMDDIALWPWGTVGAENETGTMGVSYYYDGSGTAPQTDDELILEVTVSPPVVLGFAAEATAPAGDIIINEVDASDDVMNHYSAWAATVVADYDVMLSPDADAATGAPGDTVAYMLTLTNSGNVMDTFELSAAGNTWTTTHPLSMTLAAGMSTNVTVEVAIPSGAADGASDTVTITATSMGDPSQSDSSVLTTTAEWLRLYLPIIFRSE
jgi:uncharacterized repeat protein (TIGR01451 family)